MIPDLNKMVTKWASYPEGTPSDVIVADRQRKERAFIAVLGTIIMVVGIATLGVAVINAV